MKETEKGTKEFPPCGYGVLGLCCQACLLGPCRITPFGEESERGRCGDDRDRIVARNLLRLAMQEAVRSMKDLKEAILRKTPSGLSESLVEQSKALLSPFSGKTNPYLLSLYPEKVFPSIYRIFWEEGREDGIFSRSLADLLLDSADLGRGDSSGIEEILNRCLQISIFGLASDAVRSSLSRVDGDGRPEEDLEFSEALDRLPSTSCPILIRLSESDAPQPMMEERLKRLEGVAPVLSIRKRQALSEIGRRLSKKWNLSIAGLKTVVLVSSDRVTSTLGAMGLGFSVASFPPLPIHGSERTEAFFLTDFERRVGNRYLPSWQQEVDSMITERLKG